MTIPAQPELGHALTYWRRKRGLEVAELARLAGIPRTTLIYHLSGQKMPAADAFLRTLAALKIGLDDLSNVDVREPPALTGMHWLPSSPTDEDVLNAQLIVQLLRQHAAALAELRDLATKQVQALASIEAAIRGVTEPVPAATRRG